MSEVGFTTVDLSLIPSGTVAPKEVATSGIKIDSLPGGKYQANIVHAVTELTAPDDMYNPNRLIVKTRFKTEPGPLVFADMSWVPAENETGIDSANRLYGQLENALGMYGEEVEEVLKAAVDATFTLELNESCRMEVGNLPDELKDFHLHEKGRGEFEKVTIYINEGQDDLRTELAQRGGKLRNFIRGIVLA